MGAISAHGGNCFVVAERTSLDDLMNDAAPRKPLQPHCEQRGIGKERGKSRLT